MRNKIVQLAKVMRQAKHTVIITGAGCSTESGVPDFRSPDGWWRQINPAEIANPDAMRANYELFHAFYKHRIQHLHGVEPHRGHDIIARWEQRGLVKVVITQNVDGLHQKAGSQEVLEMHGSIRHFRCAECTHPVSEQSFLQAERCPNCGASERLRPNVVMFDEMLPPIALNRAYEHCVAADLIIIIGSSLQVQPVCSLPSLSRGTIVLINKESLVHSMTHVDWFLQGKAGEWLAEIEQELLETQS